MTQSLKVCLLLLILMASVGSIQATVSFDRFPHQNDANMSVAEAAAVASNARYRMPMQDDDQSFGEVFVGHDF